MSADTGTSSAATIRAVTAAARLAPRPAPSGTPRDQAQITTRTANARPVLSKLPADSTLRELPLDQGGKPNYYCLLLKASRATVSRIAVDLTSCGLCADTIRWRYHAWTTGPCFPDGPAPARKLMR
jgi:hypothetical protein